MEDLELLKDLGSLGFGDHIEDFFKHLYTEPNVFVTKDHQDNYFLQMIFAYQDDPDSLFPKYKVQELTLVYHKEKNSFTQDFNLRNVRSYSNRGFCYFDKNHIEELNNFVHNFNPGVEEYNIIITGKLIKLKTKREFITEFRNFCFFIYCLY